MGVVDLGSARVRLGVGVLEEGDLGGLVKAGGEWARKARAGNTQANYRSAQGQYRKFCARLGVEVLPGGAEVLQAYLAWLAREGYSAGTIRAKFSAVRRLYAEAVGKDNATYLEGVVEAYDGLMRNLDGRQEGAHPLSVVEVKAMVDAIPEGDALRARGIGLRDRALVLVGFAGAFRRSELSRLCWEETVVDEVGVVFDLVHDKGQQRKTGKRVSIARTGTRWCPVAALEAWRDASAGKGPIFRSMTLKGRLGSRGLSAAHICALVSRCANRVEVGRGVTAHSLRVGMVTELANVGLSDRMIMRLTRHKSASMVQRYDRGGADFSMRYASVVGL